MAYLGTTRGAPTVLSDRLVALIDALRTAMRQRKVYRTTLRELQALSGRDLADLGLNRSMIRQVAYEAAYGG